MIAVLGGALMVLYPGEPRMVSPDWSKGIDHFDLRAWAEAYQQNVTTSARLHDAGRGLLAMSLSVLALLWIIGARNDGRLRSATTPTRRGAIYLVGNAAWIALAAALWQLFSRQIDRGQFSPVTDHLGFGYAGIVVISGLLLLPINIGLSMFLGGARLPVSLWAKPASVRAWTYNAIFGVLAALWLLVVSYFLWEGEWSAGPPLVAIAYSLLIGRAAASAG